MTLFTYCIPVDDGAAPNPFWGTCTLAICKPVIRRTAKIGDWIVGTGSVKYGFENKVVYAMQVSEVLSFEEYDKRCNKESLLKNKIPDWNSDDLQKKFGDCIYDFSKQPFTQRASVHNEDNIPVDQGGKNVLLSNNFYYFGSSPKQLSEELYPIVKQGQSHKSKVNSPYIVKFLDWLSNYSNCKNVVTDLPYGFIHYKELDCLRNCSIRHRIEDEEDERLNNC